MNNKKHPSFTLIDTICLNSGLTHEMIRCFFYEIYKTIKNNKNDIFIICIEKNIGESEYIECAINLRPDNLLIYGIEDDIYFYGIESQSELAAISTRTIKMGR